MRQFNWKFWQWHRGTPEPAKPPGPQRRPPVIRKGVSIGVCETCGIHFAYNLLHSGFDDLAYVYCDSCGRTVVLGGWSKIARRMPVLIQVPLQATIASLLKACPCGGRFSNSASPRCPSCNHELSAERATEYIERNAPGTDRGWRWQRSWSGTYCIAIEGRVVTDWLDENTLKSHDAG